MSDGEIAYPHAKEWSWTLTLYSLYKLIQNRWITTNKIWSYKNQMKT